MELRPYQVTARKKVEAEWQNGHRKTLLVLPTGTGKTIVFAKIIQDCVMQGERVLVLAHRNKLLEQASDKLKKATNIPTALERAEHSALGRPEKVVVGSVQTMQGEKRLDRFSSDYFNTLVVDEAHHCVSDSYQKVLNHFDKAKVLGVTATPDRGDMKNLGTYFDSLAYEYAITDAIKDGYLSPIKALTIPLKVDISKVKQSQGDFAVGDLGDALDPYLELIADEMVKVCQKRKTVVFLPLIKTSKKFTRILNAKGLKAAEVNGQTENQDEILDDFADDKYQVLCNSMLLTEGWDCPQVDCVVVLRPTKVRALYAQMVGRGTRIAKGKKNLLLLDFLWNTEKLELCHPCSLITKDPEVAKKASEMSAESDEPQDIEDAAEQASVDIVKQREEALADKLDAEKRRKRKLVDPLQFEMSISALDLQNYQPAFGWEMGPATDKQLKTIENYGINPEEITNAGVACQMIKHLIKRSKAGFATPKQIRLLENRGFSHVGQWMFDDARKMISRIATNGWRIPRGVRPASFIPESMRKDDSSDEILPWEF